MTPYRKDLRVLLDFEFIMNQLHNMTVKRLHLQKDNAENKEAHTPSAPYSGKTTLAVLCSILGIQF